MVISSLCQTLHPRPTFHSDNLLLSVFHASWGKSHTVWCNVIKLKKEQSSQCVFVLGRLYLCPLRSNVLDNAASSLNSVGFRHPFPFLCVTTVCIVSVTATSDLEKIGYVPILKGRPSPGFTALYLLAVGFWKRRLWAVFLNDKIHGYGPFPKFVDNSKSFVETVRSVCLSFTWFFVVCAFRVFCFFSYAFGIFTFFFFFFFSFLKIRSTVWLVPFCFFHMC